MAPPRWRRIRRQEREEGFFAAKAPRNAKEIFSKIALRSRSVTVQRELILGILAGRSSPSLRPARRA
jgi:hypothetical protein